MGTRPLLRRCREFLASTGMLAAVAVLSTWTAVPANAVGIYANDSFETPVVPAGSFMRFGDGQASRSIGPWLVVSGNVDLVGKGFWEAADGDQSLDLSGNEAGTIEQTFVTVPGTIYTVKYSLAGNPDGPPFLKRGHVEVNGADAQDFIFNVTGSTRVNMNYVRNSFTFLATVPQTALRFVSTTPGDYGPVIDAVNLAPTR